jgi:hypothetical protein
MCGKATLAMLVSSTSMNAASETAAAIIQGFPLGCQISSPEAPAPVVMVNPSYLGGMHQELQSGRVAKIAEPIDL